MKSPFLSFFGALIAFVLFLLYGGTLIFMIVKVVQHGYATSAGQTLPPLTFTPGLTYVVTTIGGLVSALVIAQLALTETGYDPVESFTRGLEGSRGFEAMDDTKKKRTKSRSRTLAWIYLAGWLILGLSALVVGVLFYPETNKSLSDIGTTWLGLAVSAAYSYFGLHAEG